MPTAAQLKLQADELRDAGRGDRAIPRYKQARELYLAEDDISAAIECLRLLGMTLVFEGEEETGLLTLRDALKALKDKGGTVEIGRVERDLGIAAMLYKHYFLALECLEESRNTLLLTSDLAERAITEAKLGRLYSLEGEYSKVDNCFDEAYQLLEKVDHPRYRLATYIDNAFACLERSQIGYLGTHLEQALFLLEQSGEMSSQLRRVAQVTGLRIRFLVNNSDWNVAREVYRRNFQPVYEDLSPGCRSVLDREINTKELKELVRMP